MKGRGVAAGLEPATSPSLQSVCETSTWQIDTGRSIR